MDSTYFLCILIEHGRIQYGILRPEFDYLFQRLGAVFPQKSDRSAAPVLTNPQTQGRSFPNNPENGNEAAESSVEAEFPPLRYFMKLHFSLCMEIFRGWYLLIQLRFT